MTGHRVASLEELPPARATLLDVTPRQVVAIARRPAVRRACGAAPTGFRYGPGVFKVDWALDGPVPWAAEGSRRAATLHLGGTMAEVAASEADVAAGRHPDRPYVLFVQYAPWDPGRAPDGKAVAWAYCHVPAGSTVDMTERIEAQVERFAPGFRDRILARATRSPAQMEAYDANDVGGDINGGIQDIRQLVFRPVAVARSVPPRRRAVPVLVLGAARRRRPRDERVPRRAVGAPARPGLSDRRLQPSGVAPCRRSRSSRDRPPRSPAHGRTASICTIPSRMSIVFPYACRLHSEAWDAGAFGPGAFGPGAFGPGASGPGASAAGAFGPLAHRICIR